MSLSKEKKNVWSSIQGNGVRIAGNGKKSPGLVERYGMEFLPSYGWIPWSSHVHWQAGKSKRRAARGSRAGFLADRTS